jgi:hypothetical protein
MKLFHFVCEKRLLNWLQVENPDSPSGLTKQHLKLYPIHGTGMSSYRKIPVPWVTEWVDVFFQVLTKITCRSVQFPLKRMKNICHVFRSTGCLRVVHDLKGQCHEIFEPRFFSLNCTPGSPDSWAKTVLHIDSNLRRSSIKFDEKNWLCALRHSAE